MSEVLSSDTIEVRIEPEGLAGLLGIPDGARGIVAFAHGSGSGRLSPRNNHVAAALRQAGLATFLLDLLTPEEEHNRHNVFDIDLLAGRLVLATRWLRQRRETSQLTVGYFGASTGAAAALRAAAAEPDVAAVVSRGGRPDLALEVLPAVRAPTLLLVGSRDGPVIGMNERAYNALRAEKRLVIVEGAGHLFEEPGTLDEVVRHATQWFLDHLNPSVERT
ncbi:dienelactone hydrolase family protein [Allomesorhizobium camelthorni]|uniref:dienelactone hydrolase family protein n=1 Tax=Allomesorhizobium camelthorni TaxID=475069 RepID=UPI00197F401C|nr:alpha/beta family hydrolase [Mesorhizobium camelthorni]